MDGAEDLFADGESCLAHFDFFKHLSVIVILVIITFLDVNLDLDYFCSRDLCRDVTSLAKASTLCF